VSDTARERAPEDHVRDALRRLNPTFHESDISWPSLDAILAEREALRTELHFSETMHQADLDERVKIEKDCRALRERVAAAEKSAGAAERDYRSLAESAIRDLAAAEERIAALEAQLQEILLKANLAALWSAEEKPNA
jgi:predicted  nucleic acid-binding Zn-ribbon protein